MTPVAFALAFLVAAPDTAAASAPAASFEAELRALTRVVACQPGSALPPPVTREMWDRHCTQLRVLLDRWQARWVARAQPMLSSLRPADLPREVVYPFGGGDLFTAMVTFPDAERITTLSLEPAGDPRGIANADAQALSQDLETFRVDLRKLFAVSHSKTDNLRSLGAGSLPQQLAFALVAITALGGEPLTLKYFWIEPDGTARALTPQEVARGGANRFAHCELVWRPRGGGPDRSYVHIGANLVDESLAAHPGVMRFLQARGRVAAMTKAASYLLWSPRFSTIRNYLLGQMDWMVSDSTGVLPRDAVAAGFVQETWGSFGGSIFATRARDREEFVSLWSSATPRPLDFWYGYPDSAGRPHLLVTRRPKPDATSGP